MHHVLQYIDARLDQPLDLRTLAEVAHFSPFHFHRLFSAWMGETLGDYLRRRRVEVAATRLIGQPRVSVLQTALAVGFGSAEAFTRAFAGRFGSSPSAWRKQQAKTRRANRNPDQADRKMDQARKAASRDHERSFATHTETHMNVKLVDRQPVAVAYLRYTGAYGEGIARFWQDTYFPWAVTNNLIGEARYGISHDDPGVTAPERCRYDAAVEVAQDFVVSGNAFKTTLPGGKYACLRFRGTVARVGEAWTALLRDWLPPSGLQLDARPCFEYYPKDARYDSRTGAFECDLCIPVVPL